MTLRILIIACFFLAGIVLAQAQERFETLQKNLEKLSATVPALNETVDISVNSVSLQEFLRGIANNVKLNINVDPALNYKVINNFSNVKVMDLLLFLAREYSLDIKLIGNIISLTAYAEPVAEKPVVPAKKLNITYDKSTGFLSLELSGDSLVKVTREITLVSGKNMILAPGMNNMLVNGYIQNMPFDNVLEKFAFANDLEITKTDDDFYLVEKVNAGSSAADTKGNNKQSQGKNSKKGDGAAADKNTELTFETGNDDTLASISAVKTPIIDIITAVSEKMGKNYFLVSEIKGDASFTTSAISFDNLLDFLFNGTEFTYKKEKNIYLLGERKLQELKSFRAIQLQYRTVEKIIDVIPADYKKDIEIKEFTDLNSLLICGPTTRIDVIEKFIKEVDKVVPVILIEVMIVDITKKHTVSTGINAGIGKGPTTTSGSLYPSVDFSLSSESINSLINSFNGFGWFNIGKVTPNFYMSIKALEDQGYVKVKSTPKLSTLNGHEATLSIGKTEYYLEESNNVIGSQNPQNIITKKYQSVNADLSITIKPIVSGDDQVTLDLSVKQSDFTARISPDAPPGSVSRNFSSLIRIKNQEMVLLGGLEEKSVGSSGRGVPLLSRIPVLKWIFSSRTSENSKNKLNIFIKPTIIY